MFMLKRAVFAALISCAVLAASVSAATKAPMQLMQQWPAVSLAESGTVVVRLGQFVFVQPRTWGHYCTERRGACRPIYTDGGYGSPAPHDSGDAQRLRR